MYREVIDFDFKRERTKVINFILLTSLEKRLHRRRSRFGSFLTKVCCHIQFKTGLTNLHWVFRPKALHLRYTVSSIEMEAWKEEFLIKNYEQCWCSFQPVKGVTNALWRFNYDFITLWFEILFPQNKEIGNKKVT